MKDSIAKEKKSGVKKCLEILPLRGGGVGRLRANAILNFHFDFLTPSLIYTIFSYRFLVIHTFFLFSNYLFYSAATSLGVL